MYEPSTNPYIDRCVLCRITPEGLMPLEGTEQQLPSNAYRTHLEDICRMIEGSNKEWLRIFLSDIPFQNAVKMFAAHTHQMITEYILKAMDHINYDERVACRESMKLAREQILALGGRTVPPLLS